MKPLLRIQILANSLVVGGAERVVEELCLRLPAEGIQVEVGTLREAGPIGERLRAAGVLVEEELAPERVDLLQIRDLGRHLRERKPDLLYLLDHSNALFYGVLAARFAGRPPVVLAVHRTGRADGSPSLSLSDRLLLRGISTVVAVSEGHREYLRDLEGVPHEKLQVVFNGVDPAAFVPCEGEERRRRRAALGLPAETPCIAILAALRPEKNHTLAFDAFERLASPAQLLLVGDGRERSHLEAEVAARKLEERVLFLGSRDDVPALLPCMDALLLPSHSRVETFPLSVLEAMASALPVVATDVGSIHEMLVDGSTGRLVEPGRPDLMAQALDELLGSPERAVEWGRNGRRRVEQHFTVDRMVGETARILRELCPPQAS